MKTRSTNDAGRLMFLLIMLAAIFSNAVAQDTLDNWAYFSSGATDTLRTVTFFNPDTGFAAGDNGVIVWTTDGGKNWNIADSGSLSSRRLRSVESHHSSRSNKTIAAPPQDKGKGWLTRLVRSTNDIDTGFTNYLRMTTDYGKTWTSVSIPTSSSLYGITDDGDIYSENLMWAVGENGTVIHSSNGGTSWVVQSTPVTTTLRTVTFWDDSTGIAAGDSGVIIRTTNGGWTWTPLGDTAFAPGMKKAMSVESHHSSRSNKTIANPGGGNLTGDLDPIFITRNKGASWSIRYPFISLSKYFAASGSKGYVSGKGGAARCAVGDNGTILWSLDEGMTWTERSSKAKKSFTGVAMTRTNGISNAVTSGNTGTITICGDGTIGVLALPAFTISPPGPIWNAGTTQTITWSGGNPSWNVLITVLNDTSWTTAATIASNTLNDGSITWNIPSSFPSGTYQIYIQEVNKEGWAYSSSFTVSTVVDCSAPILRAVRDVPNDQGGKVTVAWDRSCLDVPPTRTITYYSIWRGVNLSAKMNQSQLITPEKMTMNFSGSGHRVVNGTYWEWVGNMTAHYLAQYSYTAPTLSDSSGGGNPYFKFFVSAQTADPFVFWDSNVDSGYSVDNIAPSALSAPPTIASQSGLTVTLRWNNNPNNPDVSHYAIYRDTPSGTSQVQSNVNIGETEDTTFTDNAMVPGVPNTYTVTAVDIHGNESPSSPPITVIPEGTTLQISYTNRWNLISVPLLVNSYEKITLYPTSVTDAFAYQIGYQSQATLVNGRGYWLKFDESQDVSISGVPKNIDTVELSEGWNLIGSISELVVVNNITSVPPAITTSQFFGFNNEYRAADMIEPGKGYWVKTDTAGIIILNSDGSGLSSTNKIKIVPTNELPPPPPEEETNDNNTIIPSEFALHQAYPNPFNPTATIEFDLPRDARVTLKVYNIMGQEVTTLVNNVQYEAGTYPVEFQANNYASGIYFYRLSAQSGNKNVVETKKMLLIR